MERIKQIIEEIVEQGQEASHRSALRIYTLLENNRKLFLGKINEDDLNLLISGFNELANRSPLENATPGFKDNFMRRYGTLLFHFNRII